MAKRAQKPIVNFKSYTVLDFIDLVRDIISKMTDNDNFPTPNPTLIDLTKKSDALAKAEMAARDGGMTLKKDMYLKRADLELNMKLLSTYVYSTSLGDVSIMMTSGIPLTSDETTPPLHRDFWLKAGPRPGEVEAFCKVMTKAKAYIWMYYVGATETTLEKDWIFGSGTTRTRITITDLDSQTKVWIRVCGITKDGLTPWLTAEHIIVP